MIAALLALSCVAAAQEEAPDPFGWARALEELDLSVSRRSSTASSTSSS